MKNQEHDLQETYSEINYFFIQSACASYVILKLHWKMKKAFYKITRILLTLEYLKLRLKGQKHLTQATVTRQGRDLDRPLTLSTIILIF